MHVEFDIGDRANILQIGKINFLENLQNCIKSERGIIFCWNTKISHFNGLTLSSKVHICLRKNHKKCPRFFNNLLYLLQPWYMMMGEKLSMLKCELNHIYHKGLFCGILKLNEKINNVMIQMHDGKTMLKKKIVCKLIGRESFLIRSSHTQFAFLSFNWTW